ncbi:MAG: uracil-DNA glycosylase [Candidatus Zixiibacteriota bacterium]
MSAAKTRTELAEILRRSARTGVATGADLIIDRKRVRLLANQRRREIATALRGDNTTQMTATNVEPHLAARAGNGAKTADMFTEATGISIGSAAEATYESLDAFNTDICGCQKCPLGATRINFVFGVGNPNADLLFIGEAPGKNEDEQGEPFVGRAGQLLDKILAAIKFKREEVYIANILKCRPPANRDPQPDEMDECFPYLKEQIALIKPKIICSLGRISAQALLDTKTPVGKLRGEWHSYQGIPLRITYHPAALLRNPAFKRGCWEDMQVIRAEYERLSA